MALENRFALAEPQTLGLTDTIVVFDNEQAEDIRFFLALLNSRLLTFRFRSIGKMKGGGVIEYFWNSVSKLAIRRIDFGDPSGKAIHDGLVKLVDKMIAAKKAEAGSEATRREHLTRQCEALDRQINELVYELYGLTDKEIALVESSGQKQTTMR